MAHFAKLNENNIVLEVNIINNEIINNLPFPDSEPLGIEFLTKWSNGYTNWKQTSYNSNFRKHYASIGYIYDSINDVFYAPQPFPSWTLNTSTWLWESPVPYPFGDKVWKWDESTLNWIEII
jgi:hypothetical protein